MAGHEPVLLRQVVEMLRPDRGGVFVDCTVGLGGHARALLEAGADRIVGIDRDAAALDEARRQLAPWAGRVDLVHGDYRDLRRVLDERNLATVGGILADLGVSSLQLDTPGRGFSFRRDEPLDMRMDRSAGPTAAAWLREVPEDELADVIARFGEERFARRVARLIAREREAAPIETTGRLAAIVRRAVGGRRGGRSRIDPATRTFQAIRIAVNRELEGLDRFVADAVAALAPGARLAIIAFHSLEDRAVKHALRALAGHAAVPIALLTRRPVRPDAGEVARNPRARSARLRVAERLR
jgi:16S rRNA (cytosine1402-N4)-methyltransferase